MFPRPQIHLLHEANFTCAVADAAGGQTAGVGTPGSGQTQTSPSSARHLRLCRGSCQGASFCCKQKNSWRSPLFFFFLIGFLFTFLSVTGLTSQHTGFCSISDFRGWEPSSVLTAAACQVGWLGWPGKHGEISLDRRNLTDASSPRTPSWKQKKAGAFPWDAGDPAQRCCYLTATAAL